MTRTSARLARAHNLADLRAMARRRLPRPLFDYIEGAADDEWTAREGERGFDDYPLLPRSLVDVAHIDTSTSVLGVQVEWPVLLAPTGMSRLFHPEGEGAAARAAARAGTLYCLSSMASTSIEDAAKAAPGPKAFQIYAFRDRGLTREFIARAGSSGYQALILTVDVPVGGNRERDLRSGMTLPPRLGPMGLLNVALHPGWCASYLRAPAPVLANVAHRIAEASAELSTLSRYIANQFSPSMTWEDAAWIASEWGGPFAIKGILAPEDAERAIDAGATAVVVSSHGGRQLDGAVAPIHALPRVAERVSGRIEVLIDSGIRRGTHVLKALALGANACLVGRPYLYGLAAGGEAGVDRALALLRAELVRGMALIGARGIREIGLHSICRAAREAATLEELA